MAREENPNAFKLLIGKPLLVKLKAELDAAAPALPTKKLLLLEPELKPLELKARVRAIRECLREVLPGDFPEAVRILRKISGSESLRGFDLWPLTDYVQTYGLAHFDVAMNALSDLTRKFTAEFAMRPFLKAHPERTFAALTKWAESSDVHLRRCASESTRPRLPWAEKVPNLILNPGPGLALLEKLWRDPELYVRKSVANHLNDVSKDHPQTVIATLKRWRKECVRADADKLDWIVRHSLRGLIKKGDHRALALIGVSKRAQVKLNAFKLGKSRLAVGGALEFSFTLVSAARKPQKLVVDYVIHHVKARGGSSPKVFKLRTFEIGGGEIVNLSKRHSLKPVTTRVYYSGKHVLEIQVNGTVILRKDWHLTG